MRQRIPRKEDIEGKIIRRKNPATNKSTKLTSIDHERTGMRSRSQDVDRHFHAISHVTGVMSWFSYILRVPLTATNIKPLIAKP